MAWGVNGSSISRIAAGTTIILVAAGTGAGATGGKTPFHKLCKCNHSAEAILSFAVLDYVVITFGKKDWYP